MRKIRIQILAGIFFLGALAIVVYNSPTFQQEMDRRGSGGAGAAAVIEQPTIDRDLEHRIETWIASLEWCESRGFNNAVNPMDRDGTPSYGAFQFKPSTFEGYAVKYEMQGPSIHPDKYVPLMSDVMNYETQRKILRRMIDDPDVNFYNEFPDCVKNKVGPPPKP